VFVQVVVVLGAILYTAFGIGAVSSIMRAKTIRNKIIFSALAIACFGVVAFDIFAGFST